MNLLKSVLSSLNLNRHFILLQRLIPAASHFFLLNGKHEIIWRSSESKLLEQWSGNAKPTEPLCFSPSQYGLAENLISETGEKVGCMLVQVNSELTDGQDDDIRDRDSEGVMPSDCQDKVPQPEFLKDAHESIKFISNYLISEYELILELDFMAGELGERYDELNFMYDSGDKNSSLNDGRESLHQLVQNCIKYLNVEFAAIILPDKDISLHSEKKIFTGLDPDDFINVLATNIYPNLQKERSTLVVNDLEHPFFKQIGLDICYKLVCSPVIDEKGIVNGLLIVMKEFEEEDFTNSDRNLIEVMSRRAAKIILTSYDNLTGVLNRFSFDYVLLNALEQSKVSANQRCLLHIDICQLQVVNDTLGISAGDAMIKETSKILQKTLRNTDVLARISGGVFSVLLDNCSLKQALIVAEKLRLLISGYDFSWQQQRHDISVSIGLVSLGVAENVAGLLVMAEMACDSAKKLGRNCTQVFAKDNQEIQHRQDEMHWVNRIQDAFREKNFCLFAQPIVSANDEQSLHHFEILIRMKNHQGEIVAPGFFLPAAENYGLMPMIDRWVLSQTLTQLQPKWQQLADHNIKFAVNLSGQSFNNNDFLPFVMQSLDASPVPNHLIGFEITETAAIGNLEIAQEFVKKLKQKNCEFSLDDFGTGLSSFEYLQNISLDYLKIDGRFICELVEDPISQAMVKAISDVAKVMKLKTIAEFVENNAILEKLEELGVDYAQGYGVGRPIPLEQALNELSMKLKL